MADHIPAAPTQGLSAQELCDIIEDEALMIRHSGEIPEIAYHSSLHYLFHDEDGPGLDPERVDLEPLKEAVVERYLRITLRDITPRNRDKSIYRGLARTIVNWKRMEAFVMRELETKAREILEPMRRRVGEQLLAFLQTEADDVLSGKRTSCINCSLDDLIGFAEDLGLDPAHLPGGLDRLCRN